MSGRDTGAPIDRRRTRQRRTVLLTALASVLVVVLGALTLVTDDGDRDPSGVRTIDEASTPSTAEPGQDTPAAGTEPGTEPDEGGAAPSSTSTTATTVARPAGPGDIGVSDDRIVLGHVSGRSGAAAGARAVVAYQSSKGGIWGRELELEVADDTGLELVHQELTRELVGRAYALVGSSSPVDDAGADAVAGVPDVGRSIGSRRRGAPSNFSPQPFDPAAATPAAFEWFHDRDAQTVGAVAAFIRDDPVTAAVWASAKPAALGAGWSFAYERHVQVAETDFTRDVLRMREQAVRTVYAMLDRPALERLLRAMEQQGYRPELIVVDGASPTADATGLVFEGLFDIRSAAVTDNGVAEARLFQEWLARVAPEVVPSQDAAFAWAAGRLLFRAMDDAGPLASRAQVIRQLRGLDDFSADGLLAPAGPASRRPSVCRAITVVSRSQVQRADPERPFVCPDE